VVDVKREREGEGEKKRRERKGEEKGRGRKGEEKGRERGWESEVLSFLPRKAAAAAKGSVAFSFPTEPNKEASLFDAPSSQPSTFKTKKEKRDKKILTVVQPMPRPSGSFMRSNITRFFITGSAATSAARDPHPFAHPIGSERT